MSLSIETFKQRLLNGAYGVNDLKSIHGTLTSQSDSTSKTKLKILDDYICGKLTPTPVVTTSNEIKLNTDEDTLTIESPDTSDIGVAKKFIQVHDSAKRRNIEFTLTLADVRSLIKKTKCYYSGLKYDYSDPDKSPSFDRLDSNKGYVKGNVVSCRKDINQIKNILLEHPEAIFKDNVKLLQKVVDKWVIGE